MPSTTIVVVVSSLVVMVGSSEVVLTSTEVNSATVVDGDDSGPSIADDDVDEPEQPMLLSAPASAAPIAIKECRGHLKPTVLAPDEVRGALVKECRDCLTMIGGRHCPHHCGRFGVECGRNIGIE